MHIDFTHPSPSRRGQAAVEFALGVFILALLIAAFTELAPVMLANLKLLSRARSDSGLNSLGAFSATPAAGSLAEGTIAGAAFGGIAAPGDPWSYPAQVRNSADINAWRNNRVRALETYAGFASEPYRLDFLSHLGLEKKELKIHEEVRLPPMEGL